MSLFFFWHHLIVPRIITASSGPVPILCNLCATIIDKGFPDDKIKKDDNIMKTMTKAEMSIVELTCAHLGFPCSPSERQQLPLRPRSKNTKTPPPTLFHPEIYYFRSLSLGFQQHITPPALFFFVSLVLL